ncbi:MAG: hypothetical protein ACT4OJ_14170 [Bacteroidota bacterium]
MEYTTYDSNSIWNKRGKPATVRIDAGQQGRICFSVSAVKIMGLKEGMRLAFRTYNQDRGIIYFYEQATGVHLKKMGTAKSGIMLALFCRPLAEQLMKNLGFSTDIHKTIRLYNDMAQMPGTQTRAWMILKSNIHKPIKWRKE